MRRKSKAKMKVAQAEAKLDSESNSKSSEREKHQQLQGAKSGKELVSFLLRGLFIAFSIWLVKDGSSFFRKFKELRLGLGERPTLDINQSRAILVVGTMSSGTTGLTHRLRAIGLEVGHEESDARRQPCRDGSVSWIHGLRYIPSHEDKVDIRERAKRICEVQRPMIFSPNQFYVPFGKCYTPDPLWTPCWKRICEETFIENIGCSVKADQACPTPFQKTFILSRYPLNIISSLSTKWCTPGLENSFDPWVKQSRGKASWFAQFTNRMERYHFHDFLQELFPAEVYPHIWENGNSCTERLAWYVVEYYGAMLQWVESSQSKIIRVEDEDAAFEKTLSSGF
mmetsp:Transcript_13638/g.17775  ORF Transcript_13638/g.17775 Transcript_13638/m.17775 type:complete len:340 (-) Transcript_13638:6-1025(-)